MNKVYAQYSQNYKTTKQTSVKLPEKHQDFQHYFSFCFKKIKYSLLENM